MIDTSPYRRSCISEDSIMNTVRPLRDAGLNLEVG